MRWPDPLITRTSRVTKTRLTTDRKTLKKDILTKESEIKYNCGGNVLVFDSFCQHEQIHNEH